ncbi:hypothetical protein A2U01_0072212, partial [Trifolium medium]|nr:hypothetical protein [Trifolium medium]
MWHNVAFDNWLILSTAAAVGSSDCDIPTMMEEGLWGLL